MAAVAMPPPPPPPPPQPLSAVRDDVMDTRTPSPPVQRPRTAGAAGDYVPPDLSDELSLLSTKLVNAINYQATLDDSLQQTRHDLELAQTELARVRQQKQETDDMIASGVLVRKASVDKTMAQLRQDLAQERTARETAEKVKKQTEGELEGLTTALFEEANTMVAAARREAETVERKNSQLRTQLNDTELLLVSQTEQLQDLKGVMERLERTSEHESAARDSSVPSTPVTSGGNAWDAVPFSPNGGGPADTPPNHPLHFCQLLAPVLRADTAAYNEFQDLLSLGRRVPAHARPVTRGRNPLTSASQPNLASTSSPNLPNTSSLGGGSSSANNSPSSSTFSGSSTGGPSLKESKFYKRSLLEDIEPTLRLDLAPGLSFLSRRTVLSSLLAGTLIVEPFSPQSKFYGPVFACALCGEQRKQEPYVRKHRFRTSEEESGQRYPLCDYCVGRIRAAGDFVGFLRMVREGYWRCDSEEEQKGAWEEAVKLRERMFWARVGGGVVPAMSQLGIRGRDGPPASTESSSESVRAVKSARPSLESVPERTADGRVEAEENVGAEKEQVTAAEGSRPTQPHLDGEPPLSAIGAAIVSASSGVLSTARPDASPQIHAEPLLGNAGGAADEAARAPADEALQPSESGESRAAAPLDEAPTNLQADQAQASEQLQRESDAATGGPASTAGNSANESLPAGVGDGAVLPARSTEPVATSTPEPEAVIAPEPAPGPAQQPEKPQGLRTPTPSHERRPSSVLARVRAMEARSQAAQASPEKDTKLPGAFDWD